MLSYKKKNLLILNFILLSLNILIISFYNLTSLLSFLFYFGLVLVLNILFFRFNFKKVILTFNIITIILLILFFFQLKAAPGYYGLTPAQGIGADDVFFYSQSTNFVPQDFNLHHRASSEKHSFSNILIFLSYPLRLFYDLLPLDFLFINTIVFSFIPILTSNLVFIWTRNKKIKQLTYWLTVFCPILIMNGLILIRDGWTAGILIAGIYFLFTNNFIKLGLMFFSQFLIRIASGFEMLVVIGFFIFFNAIKKYNSNKKLKYFSKLFLILSPILLILLFLFFKDYILIKIGPNIIFREYFIERFLSDYEGSTLLKIMRTPFYIRIPFGTLFFIFAPYISLDFFAKGYFIPRAVLSSLFGILNIIYVKYFINAIVYSFSKNKFWIKNLVYIFIIMMMLLSQVSMQIRHKTMFMPLYYILVGYGFYNRTKLSNFLGNFVSLLLIIANIIVLF